MLLRFLDTFFRFYRQKIDAVKKNILLCIFIQPFNRTKTFAKIFAKWLLWEMEGWVKVNLPDPSDSFRFSECSICQFYHAATIFQSANSGTTRLWKLKQLDVIPGLSTDCIISVIAASNEVRFCNLLTFGRPWFWCSFTFGSSKRLHGLMSNAIWQRPAPTPPDLGNDELVIFQDDWHT